MLVEWEEEWKGRVGEVKNKKIIQPKMLQDIQ
jgi:hypothetical protein